MVGEMHVVLVTEIETRGDMKRGKLYMLLILVFVAICGVVIG